MKSIAVFCGSGSGNDPSFSEEARRLGSYLATQHIELVYGGAKIGLMGAVAEGALGANGKVTGIIPDFLKTKEVVHSSLSELITVKTMHERKIKMSDLADGFIVLPGGFGTMEEFFEILTWAQLGLHNKPIGILNLTNYYGSLIQFFDHMQNQELIKPINRSLMVIADSVEGLIAKMMSFKPPEMKQWIPETGKT